MYHTIDIKKPFPAGNKGESMKYYISFINLETGEIGHTKGNFEIEEARELIKFYQEMDDYNEEKGKYKYLISSETIPQEEAEKYLKQFYNINQVTTLEWCKDPLPSPPENFFSRNFDTIMSLLTGAFFGVFVITSILILI